MSKKHGSKKPRNKQYKPYQSRYGDVAQVAGGMLALSERQHQEAELARKCHLLVSPFDDDDLGVLARTYWVSFDRLKMHDASEEAWNTVAQTANMAMLFCEQGLGEEYMPLANAALEALFRAHQRGKRTGQFRLDDDGLKLVAELLEVHDEQMKHTSPLDVMNAETELKRRVAIGEVFVAEAVH